MGFDYRFRYPEGIGDIKKLERHLLAQPLGYPYYEDWVSKSIGEIETEYKKVILAFSDDFLVGNLILQPHKDFQKILEFKNMRVHPKVRERYFAVFMFKQGERIALEENYDAIICDLHSDNIPMLNLLRFMGYEKLLEIPLYDKNVKDIVMVKKFERTDSGLFTPIKQKIISGLA